MVLVVLAGKESFRLIFSNHSDTVRLTSRRFLVKSTETSTGFFDSESGCQSRAWVIRFYAEQPRQSYLGEITHVRGTNYDAVPVYKLSGELSRIEGPRLLINTRL